MMGRLSLLNQLAAGSTEWLEPAFDSTTGTVRYPGVEGGGADEGLPTALEALAARGVVDEEFDGRVVACPDCGSDGLDVRPSCPNCESRNTTAVAVVEHVVCGCVRPRAEFEADGEFVCPKCESGIESLDEGCERMGTMQCCRDCGERSDALTHRLDCATCGSCTPEEANDVRLYRYRFDDDRRDWLDTLLGVREGLTDALEARGYEVRRDVAVDGDAGQRYVDCYASDTTFGVEIVAAVHDAVDVQAIEELRAVADATGARPVIATPATGRNGAAVALAEAKGIAVMAVDESGAVVGQSPVAAPASSVSGPATATTGASTASRSR